MSDQDIQALTHEIKTLNDHKFLRSQNGYLRMMFSQFLRGLAFGLGSVVGATILVSVVAFWLSKIEFIPLIGEWAGQIAHEIIQDLPKNSD